MIKEKMDDLMPPGLICFFIYLAGDPARWRNYWPGDLEDMAVV